MHTGSGLIRTAIIHNIALAIAYGGPVFAKAGLKKAVLQGVSSPKERGKVLEIAWSEYEKINVPAHLAFTATWLLERKALSRYFPDKRTKRLVMVKDFLIGGALLTGVANRVAGEMMKRDFPDGVPYPAEGEISPEKVEKAARYITFFRVMGPLNHALIGASIATGTLIGASVVRHAGRGLLARLLKR